MSRWCVYIISKSGRYYTGITTDLPNRLCQHGVPTVLYREGDLTREQAAMREKQLKGWSRAKKETLIRPVAAPPLA